MHLLESNPSIINNQDLLMLRKNILQTNSKLIIMFQTETTCLEIKLILKILLRIIKISNSIINISITGH